MTVTSLAKRLLPLALTALLVTSVFATGASSKAQGVVFMSGNERVVQGNPATITVGVSPANAKCSLSVRYKSGAKQTGLKPVTAGGGRASWTWTVPRKVQPGRARATVSCAGAGRASHTLVVIGQVLPPKIDVVQTGWSVRPFPFGGTGVSWGVILNNTSKKQNAVDVMVLCNFVMADNRLIGSATSRIAEIAADSKHVTGGELTFPAGAPIARLEIVVQVGKSGPATHTKPGVSFIRVMPSVFEPAWTGSIEGEIQNDDVKTLQSVELSGVVLDAEGNILGGGNGFSTAGLPPAARVAMKISNGMRPIPYARAASAIVSVVPHYKIP
jgi:hypothetical protein